MRTASYRNKETAVATLRSHKKYRIKLVGALVAALFVNAGVAGSTYAWFVTNRTVFVDADEFVLDDGTMIDKDNVKIYPYYRVNDDIVKDNTDFDNVNTLAFSTTTINKAIMGRYDLMDSPLGNSILIEVPLVSANEDPDFKVLGYSKSDTFEGTPGKLLHETGNSLTSIVDIYTFMSPTSIIGPGDYTTITLTDTTKSCFVQSNKSIAKPLDMCTNDAANAQYVYVVIDYNIMLLQEVYSNNLGNEVITQGTVTFDLDFSITLKSEAK